MIEQIGQDLFENDRERLSNESDHGQKHILFTVFVISVVI